VKKKFFTANLLFEKNYFFFKFCWVTKKSKEKFVANFFLIKNFFFLLRESGVENALGPLKCIYKGGKKKNFDKKSKKIFR